MKPAFKTILGTLLVNAAWYAVLTLGYPPVLQNVVATSTGVNMQDWMDEFMRSQVVAFGAIVILILLWQFIALWSSGQKTDHRLLWTVGWFVCIAGAVTYCAVSLPDTQSGTAMAYAFAFLNGAVPYWVATVMFTAGPCKYAPVGAGRMRLDW